MFNLADDILLQKGIKIIDGIAGASKSSSTDRFFREHDIDYLRYTSTNRLKRDAEDRYNMPVKTIAAGLFLNHGAHFYTEEKPPEGEHIVIDEILQSSPKALEWCEHNADNANIIITTDSKQLLSPENEALMKQLFTQLKMRDDVIKVNLTETLRARDEKTKSIYNKLYGIADLPKLFKVSELINAFNNVIYYEDMEYDPNDAYITHDNVTEDFLYRDKKFASNPYLDLVPKGFLASRPPKDLTKYPLLSQTEANRTHAQSYTQVMNVGSAVRFQGSEIDDTHTLYFLVQPDSMVSARELYTVVTRMWNIKSFKIVIINTPKIYKLSEFNGKPIKVHRYLKLNETKEKEILTKKQMEKLVAPYDTDEIYYDRREVRDFKGNILYTSNKDALANIGRKRTTAASLAKRDASLNFSYMDEVYSILSEHGIYSILDIRTGRIKSDFEVDLVSAYPTILKYEKMPTDGFLKEDGPHIDMLNFYLFHATEKSKGMLGTNQIITDDLAEYFEAHNWGKCEYLFSTPYNVGGFLGTWLYDNTHDTQEKKADVKSSVHYGYYQRPYLSVSEDNSIYVKNESNIYQLLFCAIVSQMLYYEFKILEVVKGVGFYVDAIQMKEYTPDMVDKIKAVIPDYIDFRIKGNGEFVKMENGKPVIDDEGNYVTEEGRILYMTCDPLPTRKEKHAKQKKEWNKNLSEEKKEQRRAQVRECHRRSKNKKSVD